MLYNEKWEKDLAIAPVEPWRQQLLKAADLLRKHGHTKGRLMSLKGEFCVIGAIAHAMTGNCLFTAESANTIFAFERYLQTARSGEVSSQNPWSTAIDWNNDPKKDRRRRHRGARSLRPDVTERVFTYAALYAIGDYLALGWIARKALDGTHHGSRYCLVEWLCNDRECAREPVFPIKR